jgi:2-polyprenyl-3-methyl-5-hydroxy-6-metoxy-1,4-benzoquinol methylase
MSDHDAMADALVERVFGSLLATFDVYSFYLGDRLGFYDALASGPMTPTELADRTGTHLRYAREWLEQQAVTGVLEVDDVSSAADERRYTLPEGHAEVLTDRESLRYLGAASVQVATAGIQLPALLAAYRQGGGVSWNEFGDDMRETQAAMNRPAFRQLLGSDWFPSVPTLHDRMLGGARVADVGCGYGWSSIAMALAYPGVKVDGFDVDDPSIERATMNAKEAGVDDRVRFHARDGADLDLVGAFDVVTAFECIHDMSHPVPVLARMRELRADGGMAIVMDERVQESFTAPGDEVERLFYGFSLMVCLPDGMSHPGSVGTGTVMRPDTLRGYVREAGFSDLEILPIEHDTFRFYHLVG